MRYVFGNYTLDTQRYELYHAGTRLHLRPKVFQVLAYLLHHRDRVVRKAELLDHLWPNQFIGDATLNSCIKEVRKALGDGSRTPHFVQTIHGQGYRFVAQVAEQEPLSTDAAPPAPVPLPEGEPLSAQPILSPPTPGFSRATGPDHLLAAPPAGEHKQVTV
jgi:DNA-binding winged helix-turn-helix (wHTH) protein